MTIWLAEYYSVILQRFNSHWIAVFPITGGSEGHYIHVEAIARDGSRQLLYLGKTFKGMDHAWQIARKLGDLLHV